MSSIARRCLNHYNYKSCLPLFYSFNLILGYKGVDCEINEDECASTPCVNAVTCLDGVNSFICHCLPGYDGELCEIEIDECAVLDPCVNSALCVDGVDSFTCVSICYKVINTLLKHLFIYFHGKKCLVMRFWVHWHAMRADD